MMIYLYISSISSDQDGIHERSGMVICAPIHSVTTRKCCLQFSRLKRYVYDFFFWGGVKIGVISC